MMYLKFSIIAIMLILSVIDIPNKFAQRVIDGALIVFVMLFLAVVVATGGEALNYLGN